MRIMITGGGTGGHTSPAIAVYEELRKRDPQLRVQWVGCRGKIEERLSKALGIPFRAISVAGWPRRRSLKQVWVALKLLVGLGRAVLLLRSFRPQVVFGVGGYVSLPLMWVAQRMGIPTVIHEQNRRLGMTNRLLALRATNIYLSFDDTLGEYPHERAKVVGNPVRQEFVAPPERLGARKTLGLSPDQPVVLVCGGSQGARRINDAVAECLSAWTDEGVQLIWATGPLDHDRVQAVVADVPGTVQLHSFVDDMATACAAADIVVGRAGASTTAELAALGKPCILIPYPKATDNHQMQNARAFDEVGAGEILEDALCSGELLSPMVLSMLANQDALEEMGRKAR
ncbi:MAG: undecaprenyldiphospho-muramoylpentapeptide beta-N-acetylglucosaminyltransferase, partial [Candidatus Hydrogenedentes bacterium]|nr:undecaprenyldiphospho-muramoylpentapeptide beta-N-acetylglucosaminyltransferase [Candidatus Hydrogenedentota bacterium]